MEALSGEQVLQSNSLATITENCVVVKDSVHRFETAISLSRLSGIKRIQTSYPGLLVMASGLFVLAAGAMRARDGHDTAIVMAILGSILGACYAASRKTALAFQVDSDSIETAAGSGKDARAVLEAIGVARNGGPAPVTGATKLATEVVYSSLDATGVNLSSAGGMPEYSAAQGVGKSHGAQTEQQMDYANEPVV